MENKQTAVEWLESQQEIQDMINVYSCDAQLFLRMVFNKAKAMEKEQIMNGFNTAIKHQRTRDLHLNAERYYNETYEQ